MIDRDTNRDIWEQRLAEFEDCADVTIKDWCKNNNVSVSGFRYWRGKFKKEKMELDGPTFIPMEVMREGAVAFGSVPTYLATLEIGDFLVNVPPGFDEVALRKLLNMMRSIC